MTGLPLFKIESVDGASYDEANAFVVAAESEDQARALLSAPLDMDISFDHGLYAGDEGTHIWADPSCSTCTRISLFSIYKEPTVVLRDFHSG